MWNVFKSLNLSNKQKSNLLWVLYNLKVDMRSQKDSWFKSDPTRALYQQVLSLRRWHQQLLPLSWIHGERNNSAWTNHTGNLAIGSVRLSEGASVYIENCHCTAPLWNWVDVPPGRCFIMFCLCDIKESSWEEDIKPSEEIFVLQLNCWIWYDICTFFLLNM